MNKCHHLRVPFVVAQLFTNDLGHVTFWYSSKIEERNEEWLDDSYRHHFAAKQYSHTYGERRDQKVHII